MKKRISKKAKEVLLLLIKSGELWFRKTPAGYFRVVAEDKTPWLSFHRKTLLYAIHSLYRAGLANIEEVQDGFTRVTVTDEGRVVSKEKELGGLQPKEWDKKWRLVFFDIPEEKKKQRDAFRYQLQKAGFMEFQRSAFIYPHSCFREIERIAGELNLDEHIVMVTAETLSNEFKFKKHFGLV